MIKWNLQALWNTNSSCNDHLGYQDWRYDTVALDPGTGHVVWKASYASQFGSYFNYAYDMAVSPNGNLVYVTGQAASARTNATCAGDAVTIAYDASTGEQVWQAHYYLSGSPTDDAKALGLATSPDGTTLFVTGYAFSQVAGSGVIGSADYFVAAYDAATGGLRWVARYSNSPLDFDFAYLLNVNPDGKTLVASGTFMPPVGDFPDANSYDYGTVAYSTAPPA
jgi:hypothetical protein